MRSFHLLKPFMLSVTGMVCVIALMAPVIGQENPSKEATADAVEADGTIVFVRMPADQVRTELLHWLASTDAEPQVLKIVTGKWADDDELAKLTGEELLDLLVASFAEVDHATARLLKESFGAGPVDGVIFDGIRDVAIYRNQVQLFRARWMVQHRFYDDALPLLLELSPETVADPAGLLFYRAVCQSQLMMRRDALDSLSLLLHNTSDVPDRFRTVAEMLKQELTGQKDAGMNKVALLMQDVERRLDIGRSGEKTQQQEDAVIAALDKLLEDMEKEKDKQNGRGGGSGDPQGQQQGRQGADKSRISGAPSPGEADSKTLKENGKWGMLNPKAEAKARELIRNTFPSNFLDQIGRYTKKLAEQKK